MSNSILDTVKKSLGVTEDCDAFDDALILNINSAISSLYQIGVVDDPSFRIQNGEDLWSALPINGNMIPTVQSFISLKVRMAFDPPASSVVLAAIQEEIRQCEYRLYTEAGQY